MGGYSYILQLCTKKQNPVIGSRSEGGEIPLAADLAAEFGYTVVYCNASLVGFKSR